MAKCVYPYFLRISCIIHIISPHIIMPDNTVLEIVIEYSFSCSTLNGVLHLKNTKLHSVEFLRTEMTSEYSPDSSSSLFQFERFDVSFMFL